MTAWDPKGGSYDCDPNALPLRGGLLTHRVRADSDAYGITRPLRGRPFDRRAREPADGRHPATDLEPHGVGAEAAATAPRRLSEPGTAAMARRFVFRHSQPRRGA